MTCHHCITRLNNQRRFPGMTRPGHQHPLTPFQTKLQTKLKNLKNTFRVKICKGAWFGRFVSLESLNLANARIPGTIIKQTCVEVTWNLYNSQHFDSFGVVSKKIIFSFEADSVWSRVFLKKKKPKFVCFAPLGNEVRFIILALSPINPDKTRCGY